MYGRLGVDSATVNPMLGRDSVEPWLAWRDRLTFFLVLTSNSGASDVLLVDGLYRRLARSLTQWGGEGGALSSVGFVVGATRGDRIGEVREIAPDVAFLVPGIGAQGGSIGETVGAGRRVGAGYPGLLFHVTRGLLPGPEDAGDPGEIIRRKAEAWRDEVNRGFAEAIDE
jgi:orotidine-5'-phosphate decarboxylase